MRKLAIFCVLLLSATLPIAAQNPTVRTVDSSKPARPKSALTYISPEVQPNGSVTFRIAAPNAKEVVVSVEDANMPMAQDAAGLWTLTTQPYSPEIYSYRFRIDGSYVLDTQNPTIQTNLQELVNTFTIPGNPPMPWEIQAIPHGEINHHFYTTSVVLNAPANQDEYYVYTPPGFDAKAKIRYPVLYLLHGYSDGADGWLSAGRANDIFDSLIATGKAKPMIVVMTLGYGNLAVLKPGRTPALNIQNIDLFQAMLLTEILPRVEAEYPVIGDRDHRAIAGLSMGGGESLLTGLNHTDLFAWIGTFSAGLNPATLAKLPTVTPQKANLRLLWMACGVDDALLKPNRAAIATLKAQGLPVTAIETPGHHQWPVWRDNLIHFTPLLFQK
ncbi:esterase [Terriglobus saanensis]|uniref:Esterase n=1 Tax=Terriglobus saanensis (strain ATCC BAA-1853 / DSM 23119 / SP1PR4) TaxID=401053 RepID=E8V1T9_TERSS|nr:esterase [Terriglobus saanensis]ADV83427.1 esterase [Terriglobus saanensis SP1PR4]